MFVFRFRRRSRLSTSDGSLFSAQTSDETPSSLDHVPNMASSTQEGAAGDKVSSQQQRVSFCAFGSDIGSG